jgi:hypothetical protein
MDPVMPQPAVKLFIRRAFSIIRGIVLGEQFKEGAAQIFNFLRMSFDFHSFREWGIARGDGARSAFYVNNAETTRATWFHPVIVTKRWQFNAELPARRENGGTFRKFAALAIDRHRKHNSNSLP